MIAGRLWTILACAGMLSACPQEQEPGSAARNERAASPVATAPRPGNIDREIARLRRGDLSPARQVLASYFARHLKGDRAGAASLWCEPARALPIGDRLDPHRPYRTNNAEPLVQDSGALAGQVSIAVQILGPDNSNILDGTAWLARLGRDANTAWCITQIGLQNPPSVLPIPPGR